MAALDSALSFAARGFWVFPLLANAKTPVHKGWQDEATRDQARITKWFTWHPEYNVGIYTSRYQDDRALVVVDVDTKGDKHGEETLFALELDGHDLPITVEHRTPSGGRHLIYASDEPLRQGTDVLGSGLDIRSRGGYVVAPGSTLDGKPYAQINGHGTLADCPAWLRLRLGADRHVAGGDRAPLPGVDPDRAMDRALAYLKCAAPALEGQGGDQRTFLIACRLKDYGCTQDQAVFLMDEWNETCQPPWSLEDLAAKVAHAYKYGLERPGIDAPEAIFPVMPAAEEDAPPHPVDALNSHYAFTQAGGGHIIHETTDPKGANVVRHLDLQTFHIMHAAQKLAVGEKRVAITKLWLESPNRRSYDGFVFAPERDMGPRWYNLWRGFTVRPADHSDHPAVRQFLEHARLNVCKNDPALFHWLMSYFSHLVKKPWEKPLVALVFKGRKGTGKNALIERIGALLGGHFLLSSKRRYLTGQFNGHLENCLLLALDEAFWSGDKEAEGILKDLITGSEHVIEHKGKESFKVDNLTRVVILSNETWVIPATQDERRFAVFELGEGRMQDRDFFESMRLGMEAGGYECLLRYLLDYNATGVDLNSAPQTQALVDQKVASLEPQEQWWLECLTSGQIAGSEFGGDWPENIPTNRLRDSLEKWARKQHIGSRMPNDIWFGRLLKQMAPSFKRVRTTATKVGQGDATNHYHTPGLQQLRAEFDKFIGGSIEWPE